MVFDDRTLSMGIFLIPDTCWRGSPRFAYTFGQFMLIKSAAIVNLVGCCMSGKWLHKRGLLPSELDEAEKDEEV